MDQKNTLEDFVSNAALLAAHLSKQCEKAGEDLRQTTTAFKQNVADGNAALAAGAQAALRDALAAELPQAMRGFEGASQRVRGMVEHLESQQRLLDQRARFLGWKALASLAIASVILLLGTGYAAWMNIQRAHNASVQAEVLQALEKVTITSCDGQPCLKLEDGQTRWSKNDGYVLIDVQRAGNAAAP